MACSKDATENKDLVIQALKMTGYHDMEDLAKCIEAGKITIGGCIPITERVNEVIMKIMENNYSKDLNAPDVRRLIKRCNDAIKAGELAQRRYRTCSDGLNYDLSCAERGVDPHKLDNEGKAERLNRDVQQLEQKLQWKRNDLERVRERM